MRYLCAAGEGECQPEGLQREALALAYDVVPWLESLPEGAGRRVITRRRCGYRISAGATIPARPHVPHDAARLYRMACPPAMAFT